MGSKLIDADGDETHSSTRFEAIYPASEAVLACPKRPPRGRPGWRSYNGSGDPGWFHCGFDGYLEDREPTPERPIAECFYDEGGALVDENHPYARCGGTPDSYPPSDGWNHTFADPGGIWEQGLPAYLESRRYAADQALRKNREFLQKHGYSPYSAGPFRAPLPW